MGGRLEYIKCRLARTAGEIGREHIQVSLKQWQNSGVKMIFVPSAGRCGSSYFSKVLQASGLACPNGIIGDDGGVGFEITTFLKDLHLISRDVIIHQRRSALHQISSMQAFHPSCWVRAKTLGADITGDVVRDAMRMWIDWTRQCIELTDKHFFMEDMGKDWCRARIERWVGRELKWDAVHDKFNHREYKLLSWDELDSHDPDLVAEIFSMHFVDP